MCMNIKLCMYVCAAWACQVSVESEKGLRPPGMELLTVKLPGWCWELTMASLEEQLVIVISELSLQLH